MRNNYYYGAYTISQCEKKFGKSIMDFIDIGNMEINKMITLVQMGFGWANGGFKLSEEDAADELDQLISEQGIVGAYISILERIDRSLHLFKGTGTSIDDLRKQLTKDVENKVSDDKPKILEFKQETEKSETVLKEGETPKVDIDGYVSLDEADETF